MAAPVCPYVFWAHAIILLGLSVHSAGTGQGGLTSAVALLLIPASAPHLIPTCLPGCHSWRLSVRGSGAAFSSPASPPGTDLSVIRAGQVHELIFDVDPV